MKLIKSISLTLMLAFGCLYWFLSAFSYPAHGADQCAAPGGAGGCQSTIQAAIDAAGAGDTVRVVAGVYTENIVLDKNLLLLGGFDDSTLTARTPRTSIIDGGGRDIVVKISNGARVTVDGFTITNGDASIGDGRGGGVDVREASATIQDNLIEANVGSRLPTLFGIGGGIYVVSATAPILISDNTIRANIAFSVVITDETNVQGGFGGGVVIDRLTTATLQNNEIVENIGARTDPPVSIYGGAGGVGGIGHSAFITITGNVIRENIANSTAGNGWGGGVNLFAVTEATVDGNLIAQNTAAISGAEGGGGGISSGDTGLLNVRNNQIISNTAIGIATDPNPGSDARAEGGGLRIEGFGTTAEQVTVEDNQVIGNIGAIEMIAGGSGSTGHAEGGGILIADIATTLLFSNEISANVAVQMLSLDGDGGWGGRPSGGGLYLSEIDALTMTENVVHGNVTSVRHIVNEIGSTAEGGGLSLINVTAARIDNNSIASNTTTISGSITSNAGEGFFPTGGGVMSGCWDKPGCTLTFTNNKIMGNVAAKSVSVAGANANGGAGGGGISLSEVNGVLQHNLIADNIGHALGGDNSAFGGGINSNRGRIAMEANHVLRNLTSLSGRGAPATWLYATQFTSTNDVFAKNTGGVGCGTDGPPVIAEIVNSTFYDNGRAIESNNPNVTIYVTNTIVSNHNVGLLLNDPAAQLIGNYNLLNNNQNYGDGVVGGANDILDQEPLFMDPAADDYHLAAASPAIDAGDDGAAPLVDFDGEYRPKDGNFDGVARSDIGADEFGYVLRLPLIVKEP